MSGLRFVVSERVLFGAQMLVTGALNVLIVIAALELLRTGDTGVGYLSAAIGLGYSWMRRSSAYSTSK